jgi:hypothetical protein
VLLSAFALHEIDYLTGTRGDRGEPIEECQGWVSTAVRACWRPSYADERAFSEQLPFPRPSLELFVACQRVKIGGNKGNEGKEDNYYLELYQVQ